MRKFETCKECGHFNSLHNINGCTFVKNVSDDTKEKKLCGCTAKV